MKTIKKYKNNMENNMKNNMRNNEILNKNEKQ